MSGELQTRDKQNQEVNSSEQYAINVIGDRALQSADLLVKESKRTVEKALAGKPAPQQFKRGTQWAAPGVPKQARQQDCAERPYYKVNTVDYATPTHKNGGT